MSYKDLEYEVMKEETEYFAADVDMDGTVLVTAPLEADDDDILLFLRENEQCIRKTVDEQMSLVASVEQFTEDERESLEAKAREMLPRKTARYAELFGVAYSEVKIFHFKNSWGTCGENGVIIFNWLTMALPDDMIDYVVAHEVCHLKAMNHGEEFWNEFEKVIPDCREREAWLQENSKYYAARDLYF